MISILYIGNKLVSQQSNITTIDTLGNLFIEEGYNVKFASNKSNKLVRILDMLLAVIINRKTDYVLIDTYSTLNFYYAFFVSQLCRILNLKYIPILHGGDLAKRLEKSPKKSKLIFNNAHLSVAPSHFIKQKFNEKGFNTIEYIPNSIEIKKYAFRVRPIDTPKLLWVRSFKEIYNPMMAIKVLKALKDGGIHATLCMVGPDGDGSFLSAHKLARELKLDVTFTGKLSKEEWIKLADDYNIFINTSNFDNLPVTLIEIMALGLPMVTTNVGGIPSFTSHNDTALHVTPNDVNGMVNAIKKLVNNKALAIKLSQNARTSAEQFDWAVVRLKWKAILG